MEGYSIRNCCNRNVKRYSRQLTVIGVTTCAC